MTVSIVIPCWNAERLVGQAIESALGQTHDAVEVIVVDDGSTDGSLSAIQSFGDRIRWETGPNRGAPAARNRGLELASGELIQFLDADDLLHPEKLAVMTQAMAEAPERTLVACHRRFEGAANGEIDEVVRLKPEQDAVVMALEQVVHTSGPIYPAALLRHLGGYRPGLPRCQDYDLNLRVAMAGWRFEIVDRVLFTVRRQAGSISSDLLKVHRQQTALWGEFAEQLERDGAWTPARRSALARLYATRGRWFNRQKLFAEARACFEQADALDKASADSAFGPRTALLSRLLGRRLTESVVGLRPRPHPDLRR